MANRDAPMGLRPVYHLTGGLVRPARYKIASGYGTSIFSGDLVHLVGTGKNVEAGDAATDAPFVGVFYGVEYRNSSGEYVFSKYWPASTATLNTDDAVAFVYDDPNIVYEVQADGAATAGDIGQDADIAYTAGSTLTGLSKTELDYSDIGTGDNLHILDIVDRADVEAGSTNVKLHVLINEHSYRNAGSNSFEEV